MAGKRWKALLPEHGYVELKVVRNADYYSLPFTLHPPDRSGGIELPVPRIENNLSCIKYYPFIGAYLFWNCITTSNPASQGIWKQNNCWAYWLVWPDGKTKRDCIPHGEWVGGSISLVMTKKGAFFSSSNPDLKRAGGYLISDGKVSRLMRGFLMFPDVSPNGCRVAFSYTEITKGLTWRAAPGPRYRARAIDLCVSGFENIDLGDRENGNSTR